MRKNDIGEKIRSSLVCPMIALDILQLNKKISNELKDLLESAKEDICFIVDLSWELSRGVRFMRIRQKQGVKKRDG